MKRKIIALMLAAAMATCASCGMPSKKMSTVDKYDDSKISVPVTAKEECLEKPVIYLYGYENQKDVKVSLALTDAKTTLTYPEMNDGNTWKFDVDKNGNLVFNDAKYGYLFWEANLNKSSFTFNKGFCVAGKDTKTFLEQKLNDFHLTDQEKQDFITYWAPRMMDNAYNVVSFQTSAYTSKAKLTVTPKPTTLIRVFMAWYPSDVPVQMTEQSFNVPSRTSKTVVEWGGCQVKGKESEAIIDAVTQGVAESFDGTQTMQANGTTQAASSPGMIPAGTTVTQTDPYAQYGSMAQCARDWDSSSISNVNGKWSTINESLRAQAYHHWQEYGRAGW